MGTPDVDSRDAVHPIAEQIQAALIGYAPAPERIAELPELRRRVEAAWSAWQGAPHRFTEAAAILPELVVDVQCRRASARGGDEREACALAADLYFLLRAFTKRIGRVDLSLMVADRALAAAEQAEDELRVAAARWNLAQILNSCGQHEGALEVSRMGIDAVRSLADGIKATAMQGAMWLTAAVATQRSGDAWGAREILRTHATEAAATTGETNVFWTVFGPTNVALHRLNVEAAAGDVAHALRIADDIDVSALPSLERRTTFYLDTAYCYEQRRDDPGVLVHLLSAESTGPEDLRYNPMSRELVRSLVKRARPSIRPQVLGLAGRVGLVEA